MLFVVVASSDLLDKATVQKCACPSAVRNSCASITATGERILMNKLAPPIYPHLCYKYCVFVSSASIYCLLC